MSAKQKSGSGVPPLNQQKQQRRDASATLGHESQNTSSPGGAKEVAQLPRSWTRARLGEIVGIKYGKTLPTAEFTESGYPVFGANGIIGAYSRYLYEDRQVLISCRGAYSGAINLSPPQCFVTNNSLVLEIPMTQVVSRDYLFYALQTVDKSKLVTGSAQPQVTINNAEVLDVPLAPLPEQRRIVAEIEKQFTRLEAGVAALRRVQANLKRYRASVLKAACDGKLVPTEAELCKVAAASRRSPAGKQSRDGSATFETGEALLARILTERRQNWQGHGQYKEPAAPDTVNLPPIPEGWTWAALEAVSEAVGGFAFSSTKFVEAGYQVVKMANVRMGKIDLTQRPSFISDVTTDVVEKYSLREGDLVVTLTGTRKKRDYGYVAVVKNEDGLLLNQRIARVRPFPGMDSKFLQLAMQAEHYRDRFFSHETGNVGQGNVGMAAVTKEMITLPPLAEQTRIVAEVERRLSVVEVLEAVVSANLQRAARLRQSILQKAFTGELL